MDPSPTVCVSPPARGPFSQAMIGPKHILDQGKIAKPCVNPLRQTFETVADSDQAD